MLKDRYGKHTRLRKIADLLHDTRGFVLIFALVAAAGYILAWVPQGQDLLRTVTDVNPDHSSGQMEGPSTYSATNSFQSAPLTTCASSSNPLICTS